MIQILTEGYELHQQVIYTTIIGAMMLLACVEWLLWLMAFLYCLLQAFRKAEHWSIRVLCMVVGLSFLLLRCVVPIMRDLGPDNAS